MLFSMNEIMGELTPETAARCSWLQRSNFLAALICSEVKGCSDI